jgi:cobalamin biosynthesis Co2+ chelatase CbiK
MSIERKYMKNMKVIKRFYDALNSKNNTVLVFSGSKHHATGTPVSL